MLVDARLVVLVRLAVFVPLRLAVLAVRVAVPLVLLAVPLVRVAVLAVRVAVLLLVLLAVLAVRVAVPLVRVAVPLVRVVFRFAAMEVVVFVIFMVCFCFFGEKCFSSRRNVFLRGEDIVDSFALQEFLNSKSGTFSKKCRSFLGFLGLFSG